MPDHNLDPTRADFDREIVDKLARILAHQWDPAHIDVFLKAAGAYAAMRQCELLEGIKTKLLDIEVTIGALDDINNTLSIAFDGLNEEESA